MIKIINLLPELLGTYGDQGNSLTLSWRLTKRGISNNVINASAYGNVPIDGDFYLIGGGEDEAQIAATEILRKDNALNRALENGAQIFAVCAGFQLLGDSFPASGGRIIKGLEILPIETISAENRSVGELVTDSSIGIGELTGFENHSGQTRFLEKVKPLGIVKKGIGNHQSEACDGLIAEQIICTYMHGPALVRNPKLADYLLTRKLGALEPIDDQIFIRLHQECVERAS